MKYYFKFFNLQNEEKYKIYDNRMDSSFNINLNQFSVKIFTSDIAVNYDKITDYKFIVEKNINGVFTLEKIFNGIKLNDHILFNDCYFGSNNGNNKYRCYVELYEGGVVVYTQKKHPCIFNLKFQCDDYLVTLDNSILIKEAFEIQNNSAVDKIKFKVESFDSSEYNSLTYYYTFSFKDKIEPKDFKPFGQKIKMFEYIVTDQTFKSGKTKLHFFMKDFFGNIRYKIIDVLTKENLSEIFQIIDYDKKIIMNQPNYFFFLSKNIRTVKPKLTILYADGAIKEFEAKNIIGLRDKTKNCISINFNEEFENFEKKLIDQKEIYLSFMINESSFENEKISLTYDKANPLIIITNIENGYKKINRDDASYKITGTLIDNNLFYIGNNIIKLNFENILFTSFVKSQKNIYYLKNDKEKQIAKNNNNFYIFSIKDKNYNFFDEHNEVIPDSIVDDFVENNQKCFFIYLDKKKFNTYELNLLTENKLILKFKDTLNIIKSESYEFGDYIIFKTTIKKEYNGLLDFDIGIDQLDYSFLKYLSKDNVSSELKEDKKVDTKFENTKIVYFNTNKKIIIKKFNNKKLIGIKNNIIFDNFSVAFISLDNNEFFTTDDFEYLDNKSYKIDSKINLYATPEVTINKSTSQFKNYILNKIDDKSYNFAIDVPLNEKISNIDISFTDIFLNKKSKNVIIEKQLEEIKATIDEKYSNKIAIISDFDDKKLITSKTDKIILKININNETMLDKQNDAFVVAYFNGIKNKYKIIRQNEENFVYIELNKVSENIKQLCTIFYNDLSASKLLEFNVEQIKELYINCQNEIITGSNEYFLVLNANNFASLTLNWDKKNNFECLADKIDGDKRYIIIKRLNTNNLIENMSLHISLYDSQNMYNVVSKTVKCLFYNDTFISEYWIDKAKVNSNQLLSPSFNLYIKSFQNEFIEQIYYIDTAELDFNNRKKIAEYNDSESVYLIKNIVSLIEKNKISINVKLKSGQNIVITKKLYENNPLVLYNDNEHVTVSYEIENEFLIATFKNKLTNSSFKKANIYFNSELFYSFDNLSFEDNKMQKIKIPIKNIYGKIIINTKLIKENNKIYQLNEVEKNIKKIEKNGYFENLMKKSIKQCTNKLELIFKTDFENYKFNLKIKNIYGTESLIELKKENTINISEPGQYLLFIYDDNGVLINQYVIEAFKDLSKVINIQTNSFKKFGLINEVYIEHLSNFSYEEIKPKIEWYVNGKLEEVIVPYLIEQNDKIFKFRLEKAIGENSYIYKDSFLTSAVTSFVINDGVPQDIDVYDFTTNDNSMFYREGNQFILEDYTDLIFQTKGIKYIDVFSYKLNHVFHKIAVDGLDNVIFSSFMPCQIRILDDNKKIIKKFVYDVSTREEK